MPITLNIRINENISKMIAGGGATVKEINEMVSDGMKAGAKLWIERFLPRHFGVDSFGRYSYVPRSKRTQDKKRYAKLVRSSVYGVMVPNPNYGRTPEPLLHAGDLYKSVMRQATSGAMYEAIRTPRAAVRQQVIIPIPLPHPINPRIASSGGTPGELVRLRQDEIDAMTQRANARMREILAERRIARST